MGAWGSQVVVVAAVLAACEAPARVKPWRHAADPLHQGQAPPTSKLLREFQAASAPSTIAAARAHTLRIHVDADPGRLAPTAAASTWARRITFGTLFEPLLKYFSSPDGSRYAPQLARRFVVSPDGLDIRVELRPNVAFHDGRPLTSLDVQFSLDAMRDPRRGNAHLRRMLADVVAVDLVSAREVRIRLWRPSGWVLRALAEIPILPMHIYDAAGASGVVLVGTGPWKWVSNKNRIIHLTRNAHYWGKAPAIADLEFVYQPDAAAALTAAKRGEIDILPALIAAHWPEQASAPSVVAAFEPLQLLPAQLRYFSFNGARPPMDDVRVRHALALLIDRRTIAKRIFGGLARPVLWPIWPGGPADGIETAVPDFDPARAGKLLDESGWIDSDKDGVRDKAGSQLRVVLIGSDRSAPKGSSIQPRQPRTLSGEVRTPESAGGIPAAKTERDLFVETARRAGVVVDVRIASESDVGKWVAEGQYDLVEFAWSGISDGDIAEVIAVGGRASQMHPAIGRVVDALRAEWSPEERSKLMPQLATALAESWPISGIVAESPQGFVNKRVGRVRVWNGWIDLSALTLAGASSTEGLSRRIDTPAPAVTLKLGPQGVP